MEKKLLVWALLVCLLATLLPVSAFADDAIAEDPAELAGAGVLDVTTEEASPAGADIPVGQEDLDEPAEPVILSDSEGSQDEPVGDGVLDVPYEDADGAFVDPFLDAETDALSAADETQEIVDSGTCGDNLTWTLDSERTLTISGSGAMTDYDYNTDVRAPWYSQRSSFDRVVLEPGVTRLGGYAFYNCLGLQEISLPDSLQSIGDYALGYCSSLSALNIPQQVNEIGTRALCGLSGLSAVQAASVRAHRQVISIFVRRFMFRSLTSR